MKAALRLANKRRVTTIDRRGNAGAAYHNSCSNRQYGYNECDTVIRDVVMPHITGDPFTSMD